MGEFLRPGYLRVKVPFLFLFVPRNGLFISQYIATELVIEAGGNVDSNRFAEWNDLIEPLLTQLVVTQSPDTVGELVGALLHGVRRSEPAGCHGKQQIDRRLNAFARALGVLPEISDPPFSVRDVKALFEIDLTQRSSVRSERTICLQVAGSRVTRPVSQGHHDHARDVIADVLLDELKGFN